MNYSDKNIKYIISPWEQNHICREKAVSFTGPRPNKYDYYSEAYTPIKQRTHREILRAAENGYTQYLVGGCSGFDLISARYCLAIRKSFGYNIEIICILPYENFYKSNHFDKLWTDFYISVINSCDYVFNPCGHKGHMGAYQYQQRNQLLVDNSSLLIAMNPFKNGGSNNTVKYSLEKGVDVIDVSQN